MKLNTKSNKGFTIIEVLIVLAIAGVTLALVLIAAPNLQRNSRNSQIRSDANNILAYANDWVAANNGTKIASACYDTTTGNVNFSSTTTCTANATNTVGKVRTGLTFSASTTATQPSAVQTINLGLDLKCNGSSIGTGASSRALAAGFVTETATGTQNVCLGL